MAYLWGNSSLWIEFRVTRSRLCIHVLLLIALLLKISDHFGIENKFPGIPLAFDGG
jgi:hypothetical protein